MVHPSDVMTFSQGSFLSLGRGVGIFFGAKIMSEFEQIIAKLNDLESLILKSKTGDSRPDMELVSAETLANMWDVKIRTIREWVTLARNNPSNAGIPFVQMPGSRLIRFPLKKVKEWYSRGQGHD